MFELKNDCLAVEKKRVLITGSKGFIGKNLVLHLSEKEKFEILSFNRENHLGEIPSIISQTDFVIHLAAENRPNDPRDFKTTNIELTQVLARAMHNEAIFRGRKIPLIFASSTQAVLDNLYGQSKLAAEQILERLALEAGVAVSIYRLPGVFGKFAKPHYNSVVATFCHNIARGESIEVRDPDRVIELAYIDDVVSEFADVIEADPEGLAFRRIQISYSISVSQLETLLKSYEQSRENLLIPKVGNGLERALYSTYVSYLPKSSFSYRLSDHLDCRGSFTEIIKTIESGQFSFFTANPGVTRGGHYHHTKTEKFLVVRGRAKFSFKHVLTDEFFELSVSDRDPTVVDSVPGWAHEITNVGSEELIVFLWANEIFDRLKPDTISFKVEI